MTSDKSKTRHMTGFLSPRSVTDVIAVLFVWIYTVLVYSYLLMKIEDRSLFLYDRDFFIESFKTPGGFIGWLGAFFTQFLHTPWAGALLWLILLSLTVWLYRKTYPVTGKWAWSISYIPAVSLVIYSLSSGYGIFLMKSPGWFFSPVIGTIFTLSSVYAITNTRKKSVRYLLTVVITLAGYILSGAWGVAGCLIAAIGIMVSEGMRKSAIQAFVSIVSVAVIPIILQRSFTTYRSDEILTIGLPLINHISQIPVRLPCFIIFITMAATSFLTKFPLTDDGSNAERIFNATVTGLSILAILMFSFHDSNLKIENAMSAAIDRNDWKEVASILRKAEQSSTKSDEKTWNARTSGIQKASGVEETDAIIEKFSSRFYEPTRLMILYKDLALFMLGTEADEMFTFRDGDRKQKGRYHIPLAFQAGKQLYFYYGMVNYSHRWCIEETVEYGWSYSALKYAAMTAMAMYEWELADKYLSQLEKTLFYREWARTEREMCGSIEKVASAEPYSKVLPLICYDDRLSNDEAIIEPFLMNHFISDRGAKATPEFDRAAMMSVLRMQDIDLFWPAFLNYLETNKPKTIPRHYQEATIMYSSLEGNNQLSALPFDKKITDGYSQFESFVSSHPVRNLEESAYTYSKRFGKTFWFYYYFIRGQETF